jgi:hypothetical protein
MGKLEELYYCGFKVYNTEHNIEVCARITTKWVMPELRHNNLQTGY